MHEYHAWRKAYSCLFHIAPALLIAQCLPRGVRAHLRYTEQEGLGTGNTTPIMYGVVTCNIAFQPPPPPSFPPDLPNTQISLSTGDYFLDGPIFIKSGVTLGGGYSDDAPNYPFFQIYDGPNTASTTEDAMIVIDGATNAEVSTQKPGHRLPYNSSRCCGARLPKHKFTVA